MFLSKKKFKGKLKFVSMKKYISVRNKIKNLYLKSKINDENMSFVYSFSKLLKIKEKNFISAMQSFSGLPHRFEIFLKKRGIIFINDSKATTFEATQSALTSLKNIYWIVGGLPKHQDRFYLKKSLGLLSSNYHDQNHCYNK